MKDETGNTLQLLEELNTLRTEVQQYRTHMAASAQYQDLFESLQEVFFRTDTHGNIILVSPSIVQLLGYTQEDAAALNIAHDILVHPDDWQALLGLVEENRYREEIEVLLKRWDGSCVWGSAIAQWYTDAHGRILGIEGFLRDITRRKHTEDQLRQNEEKYRMIVENIPDGFLLHDVEGTILEVNENLCQMTGYSRAELIGQNLRQISAPHGFERHLLPLMQSGPQEAEIFDAEAKHKDGRIVPVNISTQMISDQGKGIIQAFVRDITARKHDEKLLKLHTERLEALVHLQHMHESSIEEIVEYTLEKVVELTGSTLALLNYVSTDESGTLVPSIWSKGLIKTASPMRLEYFTVKNTNLWDDVLTNPTPHIINECTAPHAGYAIEGYAVMQRLLIVPVFHEDELVLLSAVANKESPYDATDCHELTLLIGGMWNHIQTKMAADELRRANEQLQELNASKDTFFSIIAHDLRGPLSSLHELTQHVEDTLDSYDLEELKELIMLEKVSAETLYKLLENLLTWSRVQRGILPYQPQPVNLRWFITRNLELLELHARKKHIRLTTISDHEILVYADFNMVDTIIRNLVSNAIKFTQPGGSVTISVQPHERFVEIAVTDTGIGIEEEYLPTLFQIDTRYKRMGTADEEGSGLGLILCKEFVEKHECDIWVESTVGQGTTFRFTLPRMPEDRIVSCSEDVLSEIVT